MAVNAIHVLYLTSGLFKAVPSKIILTDLAKATNIETLAKDLGNTPYAINAFPVTSNAEKAKVLAENLLGSTVDADAKAAATTALEGVLNANDGNVGVAALIAIQEILKGGTYADAKAQLENRVKVAEAYVNSPGGIEINESILNEVTKDPATVTAAIATGGSFTGQTFTLTTGTDNVTGTAGNDTIIGDNSGAAATNTVSAGDQINGGDGVDTFKYYGAAPAVVVPALSNVENLVLINPAATTGLDVTTNSALQNVTYQNYATNTALAGIALNATQTIGLDNVTSGNTVTVAFGTAATPATAATLNVSNGTNVSTVNLNGAGIKTLNVASTGTSANTIATLASTGPENKVVLTGTQKLTITNALANTVKTVDASATTAGVVVTAGNTDVTFTGGTGNDTIKFAAGQFTTLDIIDGGAGADTLSLADTGAPSADLLKAINAAKNVETLAFSGAGATVNAALITNGATSFQKDTAAGNFVLTNVTSAGTVTYLALDNSASTDSIANKLGDLTSNVTLTANSTSAAKTGAMTLTGVNTVNLKSDFTGTGSQATANAFGTTGAGNSDNTKFVVTGTQDLVLGKLAATTTGSTVDASAFTGKLTATGSGKADAITGGSGADTLGGGDITGNTDGGKEQFTATFTGGDGTNAFTVTFDGAATASVAATATAAQTAAAVAAATYTNWDVTYTAGTDAVTFTAKTVGNKTFTGGATTAANGDFVKSAGTGGVATVSAVTQGVDASAGTGTAAADVLTGNGGADTFVFKGLQESAYAADASTVDTIKDFTAGGDKLDISGIIYNAVNSATGASSFGSYQSTDLVAQATVQSAVNAAAPSTLAAAVTAAATQIAADKVGAFQYGGDTYVFLNDHTAGVSTDDGLIKLTGAVTLTATDFVFHA